MNIPCFLIVDGIFPLVDEVDRMGRGNEKEACFDFSSTTLIDVLTLVRVAI